MKQATIHEQIDKIENNIDKIKHELERERARFRRYYGREREILKGLNQAQLDKFLNTETPLFKLVQ